MLLVSSCLRLAIIFSTIDSSPRLFRLSISRTINLFKLPSICFIYPALGRGSAYLLIKLGLLNFLKFRRVLALARWDVGTTLTRALGLIRSNAINFNQRLR